MPMPPEEDELVAVRLLGLVPPLTPLSDCPGLRSMGKLCGPLVGGTGSPALAGKLLGPSPACTERVCVPLELELWLVMADSAVASMF